MTSLIPITAIVLGTLRLGESLEAKHYIGMALIGCGLAAIDGRILRALLNPRRRVDPGAGISRDRL